MEVHLTENQAALIRQAIEDGRYVSEENVLRRALAMWEKQERRRAGF